VGGCSGVYDHINHFLVNTRNVDIEGRVALLAWNNNYDITSLMRTGLSLCSAIMTWASFSKEPLAIVM
jgi:hypothetical protein